jgi:hypothetical protein
MILFKSLKLHESASISGAPYAELVRVRPFNQLSSRSGENILSVLYIENSN